MEKKELIKRLRRYANDYDKGRSLGRYIQGTAELLLSAACSDWCEECEMCGGLQGLTPKNYNPQNFCHDCGRPLNKEAEEIFNRRLKGEKKRI